VLLIPPRVEDEVEAVGAPSCNRNLIHVLGLGLASSLHLFPIVYTPFIERASDRCPSECPNLCHWLLLRRVCSSCLWVANGGTVVEAASLTLILPFLIR
jgi:hypothetical protein